MTKRFSRMQKKLRELELVLSEVFSLHAHTDSQFHRLYYSQDIDQRFLFLKKLLSAEVASSPTKPHHLQHICKRLEALEASFRDWDEFRASALEAHNIDTASTRSCTESCLNGDGDETIIEENLELGSQCFEDPVNVLEEFVEGKAQAEAEKTVGVEETKCDLKRKERVAGAGSLSGAVACGLVIGMALMGLVMARFCGCCASVPRTICLTPTQVLLCNLL